MNHIGPVKCFSVLNICHLILILLSNVGFCQLSNHHIASASETVGIERRLSVTMAVFVTFTAGYITSPLISYLVPNWRWFLRVISFLGIIYIPLFWYDVSSLFRLTLPK